MKVHLNITEYGKPEKPKLLFLHGACIDSSVWSKQIEFFKDDFFVLTIDLPEHGKSGLITSEYTVESIAKEIGNYLNSRNLKDLIICGLSLGGMVAQYLSAMYPNLVKKLVLVETAFGTRTNLIERILSLVAEKIFAITPANLIVKMSVKEHGKINKETGEYLDIQMKKFDNKQIKRITSAALNYDGKEILKKITADTLIVVGQENKRTHRQAEIMNRLIRKSEIMKIKKAGHIVNMDNPKEFNEAIWNFTK